MKIDVVHNRIDDDNFEIMEIERESSPLDILNVKDVANLLSKDAETVRRWLRTGKLKALSNLEKAKTISTGSLAEFLSCNKKYEETAKKNLLKIDRQDLQNLIEFWLPIFGVAGTAAKVKEQALTMPEINFDKKEFILDFSKIENDIRSSAKKIDELNKKINLIRDKICKLNGELKEFEKKRAYELQYMRDAKENVEKMKMLFLEGYDRTISEAESLEEKVLKDSLEE